MWTRGALEALAFAACLAAPAIAQAAPGDLDPSFGRHGVATQGAAIHGEPILTPDGGAAFLTGGDSPAIVKVDRSGAPDEAFGEGGHVALAAAEFDPAALAVGTGGDLYVAGTRYRWSQDSVVVVERISPDGKRDDGFSGVIDYPVPPPGNVPGETAGGIAVHGENVLVGLTVNGGLEVTLAKLHSDGDLDGSFGEQGFTHPIAGYGSLVLVDDDDYLFGTADEYSNQVRLARYDQSGELEASFGEDGTLVAPGNRLVDLALGPGGRLALAHQHVIVLPTEKSQSPARVDAFTRDGDPLPGFDSREALRDDDQTGRAFFVSGLTFDDEGRMVLAGARQPTSIYSFGSDPVLARLEVDGSLDRTFGEDGLSLFPARGIGVSGLTSVTMDFDGRLLTTARSFTRDANGDGAGALARFLSSAGKRDADADGRRDEFDACPRVFGRTKGGCPRVPVQVDAVKRGSDLTGKVRGERGCFAVRRGHTARLVIRRKQRGADPRVGRAQIQPTRLKWRFDGIEEPGAYYAQFVRTLRPTLGICRGAKSRAVRFR